MEKEQVKPLNWKPDPHAGYTVERRPDGGMYYVFTSVDHATLVHWREFAVQHLYDSDRLTRNLYDLRQVKELTAEAIQFAVEVNSDPAARNIRVAVIVANPEVRSAVMEIAALSAPGGVELGVFLTKEDAEAWLDRPLTTLV